MTFCSPFLRRSAQALFVLVCLCGQAHAQRLPVGDELEDYARLLQLTGDAPATSFNVRPLRAGAVLSDTQNAHPWASVLDRYAASLKQRRVKLGLLTPGVSASWNSAYPSGQNDGPAWQGRGATAGATAGAFVKLGPLSAALRPSFIYAMNRPFETWPGVGETAYPLRPNLDLPQRFGPEPFTVFDLGQSYARLDLAGLALGVSNENLWWGPGIRNAIVMSNNAPGFPHLLLGTSGPVNVGIGRLQAEWRVGRLSESGYYWDDPRKTSDDRFFNGFVADFSPRGFPGFSVGATRVFVRMHDPKIPLSERDLFVIFQSPFKSYIGEGEFDKWGFDKFDQMVSVFARGVFPEEGFEVYGEYAWGDHFSDPRDLMVLLQHAGGYTLGLQKAHKLPAARLVRTRLELTRLEASKVELSRTPGTTFFYVNSVVRQGYTHRGQIIGAGIGPGSNNQHLSVDLFMPEGRVGLFINRTVYDNDRFNSLANMSEGRHEVELSSGASALAFVRGLEFGAGLSVIRRLNRYYVQRDDVWNVQASLSLRTTLTGYR